jgi:SAM-dependent methyltransferase
MAEVWGAIFRDHFDGERVPHVVERDDGRREASDTAAHYFEAPRLDGERELLGSIEGPVLDLGAGPGSYALYLQSLGLEVTAADSSTIAVEVCRRRGCRHAEVMDLRNLDLEPASFGSVIIMGNTLGAHQTPESLPRLLRALRAGVRPGGHLLVSTVEPLETEDPAHLAYHRKNRDRGLPPGLTRIRMSYKDIREEWMYLWMPTGGELAQASAGTGWRLAEERAEGPFRVRLFQATAV